MIGQHCHSAACDHTAQIHPTIGAMATIKGDIACAGDSTKNDDVTRARDLDTGGCDR